MGSVGELSKVCSQIVLKCLHLARIGRPDILWSVSKLARSITKWTKACDKRLSRLISYIHHTCEYKQYCHVGKHCQTMQIGTVSRLRFCRRTWGFKIYIRWNIVRFGKSYICVNKLDVQETNFSFTHFNRIRNHFLGRMIEVGRYTHTWFMGSDCFNQKVKGVERSPFTSNGSEETVELILRTVISVNQLSIDGAVAGLRKELDPYSRKQTVGEICESLVIPTTPYLRVQHHWLIRTEFAELLDDQKLSKLCSDAGFLKEIGKGQFFITIEEGSEVMQTACREYTQLSKSENIPTERVDSFEYETRPGLGCQNLSSRRTLLNWYHDWILV